MAEFEGAESIGFLLGGGSKMLRQQAFEEGRLNTAKTEQALSAAREMRLKAQAAATKQREAERFEEVAIANGMPPAQAALIGNLMRSEGGADFSAGMTGLETGQEMDFRDIVADPTKSAVERLRAGQGIQGKVTGDFGPIGAHGVVDLTKDVQELIVPPGGGGASTAVKNYEYSQSLPPDERSAFNEYVRADRIINAGGVPYVAPGFGGGGAARAAVDPEQVAANAASIAGGKRLGTTVAVQKADYPMVRYTLNQNKLNIAEANKVAMELLADDKLWQSVGPTAIIANIPGTQGAYLRGKLDVLGNKTMLQTLINLRAMSKTGGAVGNVSDREGETMRAAIAAITSQNIMAGDMRKELERLVAYNKGFERNMEEAFKLTYDEQGNPRLSTVLPGPGGAPEDTEAQLPIEDIIVNSGDGEYDERGNVVRADGWILMKDASGNVAWVSPDGTQYEEVAQ